MGIPGVYRSSGLDDILEVQDFLLHELLQFCVEVEGALLSVWVNVVVVVVVCGRSGSKDVVIEWRVCAGKWRCECYWRRGGIREWGWEAWWALCVLCGLSWVIHYYVGVYVRVGELLCEARRVVVHASYEWIVRGDGGVVLYVVVLEGFVLENCFALVGEGDAVVDFVVVRNLCVYVVCVGVA